MPLSPTERKARLLELADLIEQESVIKFDMVTYGCGSAGCIAGTAMAKWNPIGFVDFLDNKLFERKGLNILEAAAKELGLTHEEAVELFAPDEVDLYKVTKKAAAEVVRHFANTGEIVWPAELLYHQPEN